MAYRAAVNILSSFQKSSSVVKSICGRNSGILSQCYQYRPFSGGTGNLFGHNVQVVPKISDVNGFMFQKHFHTLNNPFLTKSLLNVLRSLTEDSLDGWTFCKPLAPKELSPAGANIMGAWIRTRGGRFKSMWKRTGSEIKRRRAHVFCNSTQSIMFDKMVNKFWRKRKYYVDDPYESYHKRSTFWITKNL